MKWILASCALLVGACTANTVPDLRGMMVAPEGGGAVELIVKTSHPAILRDISAGGGPDLTRAMEAAAIPPEDRAARILALQSDFDVYESSPGALTSALRLWGA